MGGRRSTTGWSEWETYETWPWTRDIGSGYQLVEPLRQHSQALPIDDNGWQQNNKQHIKLALRGNIKWIELDARSLCLNWLWAIYELQYASHQQACYRLVGHSLNHNLWVQLPGSWCMPSGQQQLRRSWAREDVGSWGHGPGNTSFKKIGGANAPALLCTLRLRTAPSAGSSRRNLQKWRKYTGCSWHAEKLRSWTTLHRLTRCFITMWVWAGMLWATGTTRLSPWIRVYDTYCSCRSCQPGNTERCGAVWTPPVVPTAIAGHTCPKYPVCSVPG